MQIKTNAQSFASAARASKNGVVYTSKLKNGNVKVKVYDINPDTINQVMQSATQHNALAVEQLSGCSRGYTTISITATFAP